MAKRKDVSSRKHMGMFNGNVSPCYATAHFCFIGILCIHQVRSLIQIMPVT